MTETRGRVLASYLGIALLSAAVITLEITLTRVFSVAIWYHFAFMVVSIALLGFGASGAAVTLAHTRLRERLPAALTVATLLFALTTLLTILVVAVVPFDPFELAQHPRSQILYLVVYYVTLALPFFCAGVAIALLLSSLAKRVNRLYFADLTAAGLGAVATTLLLPWLGAIGTIAAAAAVGVAAAVCFGWPFAPRARVGLLASLAVAIVLAPALNASLDVHIPQSKALYAALRPENGPTLRPEYTAWNAFSRIDVTRDASGHVVGLAEERQKDVPPQLAVRIDADAFTAITRFDGDLSQVSYVRHIPASLAYMMRPERQPKVLIIGAGGGTDVLAALHFNASQVTGVELNPIIVDLVKERYRAFAGDLYRQPKVNVVVDEGRNFVSRSNERYDVLQLSLVDTWAAVSSGAYSLAENYLYTREAFEHYYDHLTDDGYITISRWYGDPPVETLRLVSTALAALEARGVANPDEHVALIKAGNLATLVVKRGPLSDSEIGALERFAGDNQFEVVYAPSIASDTPIDALVRSPDRAKFMATYPYNITPVTDDSPFFFQIARWSSADPLALLAGRSPGSSVGSGPQLLVIVLLQALILALALILGPLFWRRRGQLSARGAGRFLLYFIALGMGYLLIEIALMQKFNLFLGHPVFSLSVVLFALLCFSGLGSLASGRLRRHGSRALAGVVVALVVVTALELALLGAATNAFLGAELPVRIVLSVLLIAPLGFLMGMPFPLGISLLEQTNPDLIPWAWGVNGCASVIGPVIAQILAISTGFTVVVVCAGVIYLLGALVMTPGLRSKPGKAGASGSEAPSLAKAGAK